MKIDYRGRRVTIMGLGHFGGGVAAARWLARQGAIVAVTDLADEKTLADSLPLLGDVPIEAMHLGGHRNGDFLGVELIVVNPAVRPDSPWLGVARRSGARLVTEVELFMENCPARVIGVTGSNGKSTTAAMIASILRSQRGQSHFRVADVTVGNNTLVPTLCVGTHDPRRSASSDPTRSVASTGFPCRAWEPEIGTVPLADRRTFLGGNIGGSLLEELTRIGPNDWVVLELSSFQLWHFSPTAKMPHVAVVTGCTPNHLDWHGSLADYVAAKQRILVEQTPEDTAVLNGLDAEVAGWSHLARGRLIIVEEGSRHTPRAVARPARGACGVPSVPAHGVCGLHLDDVPPLAVPGEHNRVNAACAAAAAIAAGCQPEEIRRGLESFRTLPQRLEWLAVVEGRRFYNDSAATTPESAIAALRSLDMPAWLLAGGKAKGSNLEPLALEIAHRARGAAFFGSVREELRGRVAAGASELPCTAVETLDEAFGWCWGRSRPGEAILLSPGFASTDQFGNFRQRGEQFAELVRRLANRLNR